MVPDVFDICLYICEWKWYDQFAFFLLETHKEKLKKSVEINTKTTHTLLRIYIFLVFGFFLNSFSLPLPYGGNLWYRMLGIFILYYTNPSSVSLLLLLLLCYFDCWPKINRYLYLYVCVCVCVCFFEKGPNISPLVWELQKKHKQKFLIFFYLGERYAPWFIWIGNLNYFMIIIISLLSDVW